MNPIYKGQYPPKSKDAIWVKGKKIYIYGPSGWQEATAEIIIDDAMVEGSANPVQSKIIQQSLSNMNSDLTTALGNKQNVITPDTALSETSENAIENSAVYKQYMDEEDIDSVLAIIDPSIIDMRNYPLTFTVLSPGNITWKSQYYDSSIYKTIEYKKNDEEWTSITSSYAGESIAVEEGDVVKFRGDNTSYGEGSYYTGFNITATVDVKGNIMSLISSTDFKNLTTFSSATKVFLKLFYASSIRKAGNLILPADVITTKSYYEMFMNCTSLIEGPQILGTTAEEQACDCMFVGCSSLTSPSAIHIMNFVGDYSCRQMFGNCTSLVVGPDLPALTAGNYSYAGFFSGCSSLNSVKCMLINNGTDGTWSMFSGVGSTGTLYKNPNLNSWFSSTYLPDTWTVVDASE